jgi:hypothetical protein
MDTIRPRQSQEAFMGLTFSVIGVFALVLLGIGLLMTRKVRYTPIPTTETAAPSRFRGGEFTMAISLVVLALTIGALLWFWAVVALPH